MAEEQLPQSEITGVIAEIRTAVMDGNSYYFLRLEDETCFYTLSASSYPIVVILNVGDTVKIEHQISDASTDASILEGYSIALIRTGPSSVLPQEPSPSTDSISEGNPSPAE